MRYTPALLTVGLCAIAAPGAEPVIETVQYQDGDVALQGYLAKPADAPGKLPGVIVVHEWWGLNDYAKRRARELAGLGYVALAADYYGGGKVGATREEAGALAGSVRGQPAMRTRGQAAYEVLKARPDVDPNRIAIRGFCFGGTAALELSYTGADLAAVITIHGGLTVPTEDEASTLMAHYLILHGAADGSVKQETIDALGAALTKHDLDWEFIAYGGAPHAFSNPDAGDRYREVAARRSWRQVELFLAEVLAK